MKRVTKIFTIFILLSVYSFILESCCTETYRIIGGGTIEVYDVDPINSFDLMPIDTIRNSFYLAIKFETELSSNLQDFSLMNTAYAVSCDYEIDNPIDRANIKLTCDNSFELGNDTIEANTDFAQNAMLNFTFYGYPGIEGHLIIEFPKAFIDQAVFQKEEYTFKVEGTTTDDIDVESEVRIQMDL